MTSLSKKINFSINLIEKAAEMAADANQPLEICYSGGKDSDVILELARMSGVDYRAIYKNTTIDPPGTIKHCIDNGVEVMKPAMTFAQIIQEKGLPSRYRRFCCGVLKEYKILDYAVVGIRREESNKRKKLYKEPETCRVYAKGEKSRQYMPILYWNTEDISQFVTERKIKCHPLYYDENGMFDPERRLGCLCCPLSSRKKRINEFKNNPKMLRFYARNAGKFIDGHRNCKAARLFRNEFELLFYSIFCDSMRQFREITDVDIFGNVFDCKEYLERKFGLSLDY